MCRLGRATTFKVTIQGLNYVPRQDMGNGRISDCEVFCASDPKVWGEPTAKITWRTTKERQTYGFAAPVKARYVKLLIPKRVLPPWPNSTSSPTTQNSGALLGYHFANRCQKQTLWPAQWSWVAGEHVDRGWCRADDFLR
jgi:hypothetical protein